MMENSLVTPKILTERLDAEFYRPAFLDNAKLLSSMPQCRSLGEVCSQIKLGYTGPIDKYYGTPGACFLTSKNIAEGRLKVAKDIDRVRFDVHNGQLASTKAIQGDLLFSRTGTVGKAAVLHDGSDDYNFAAHLIALRTKPEVDPDYLSAFFNCKYGKLQSARTERGTIIRGISIYDMPALLFPEFSALAQQYIGAKVRYSQRLHENAESDSEIANRTLHLCIPEALPKTFHDSPRRIGSQFVSENSLSPEYGRALLGHKLFDNALPLREYVSECKCGEAIRMDARNEGLYPYYGASGPIDFHDAYNFDGEYLIVAQDGTIGCASVGRGRFWANNHVWVLRVKPEYDPDAIAAFLHRCYPFWKGMTTGSVVPKVTSENLLCVNVPQSIATAKLTIGVPLRRATQQLALAEKLINASKILVEGLIDGVLSDAELSTAYTQLEKGDLSCDKAILARVYEGGIDATDTQPLLPDLDAYYETLHLAKQALADGGIE
jgi:type I restriction enzyme S subunit